MEAAYAINERIGWLEEEYEARGLGFPFRDMHAEERWSPLARRQQAVSIATPAGLRWDVATLVY